MLPFRRLVADQLDPSSIVRLSVRQSLQYVWRRRRRVGRMVCLQYVWACYTYKPAVVVDRVVREEEEEVFVGIGDRVSFKGLREQE